MTTWKDGGDCGRIYREIVNEDESHVIAKVRTRHSASYRPVTNPVIPWPGGEANFRLILKAPQMLAALEAIAKGAIVSPDQTPEKITEQVLRVLRLVQEENLEYLKTIGVQQGRAERAEAALEAIRDQAECYLQPLADHPSVNRARWEAVRDQAVTTITAVEGENMTTSVERKRKHVRPRGWHTALRLRRKRQELARRRQRGKR